MIPAQAKILKGARLADFQETRHGYRFGLKEPLKERIAHGVKNEAMPTLIWELDHHRQFIFGRKLIPFVVPSRIVAKRDYVEGPVRIMIEANARHPGLSKVTWAREYLSSVATISTSTAEHGCSETKSRYLPARNSASQETSESRSPD
jgi:hypothetical protein